MMILSMAFMIREVRATGLRSFRTLVVPFFGMGITVELFHIAGTVLLVKEPWNRCWNTPPSCSAQCHRVRPQMLSGPGAVFFLVLLRALTTSDVLMLRPESSGLSVETMDSSWVLLSFSNLV